jgi:hypothetical protein
MAGDLVGRLRALARHDHSDVSVADEAADELEAASASSAPSAPFRGLDSQGRPIYGNAPSTATTTTDRTAPSAGVGVDARDARDALRKAFLWGELHWSQADSESTSQHRKADETRAAFKAWADETAAALQHPAAPSVEDQP